LGLAEKPDPISLDVAVEPDPARPECYGV